MFSSRVNDIPHAHPDFVRGKQYQRSESKKAEELFTCTYCGSKHPERSMAHIGEGVYKCRRCLLNQ